MNKQTAWARKGSRERLAVDLASTFITDVIWSAIVWAAFLEVPL